MIGNESKIEVLENQLDSLKSQVFVLFGLLVLTLGGLTYCLFTLFSDQTIDSVRTKSLHIVDNNGAPTIQLASFEREDKSSHGVLLLNTTKGVDTSSGIRSEISALVQISADTEMDHGLVTTFTRSSGNSLVQLGCTASEDYGLVMTYDSNGEILHTLPLLEATD